MTQFELSQHATTRCQQRSFRSQDLEAILSFGTDVAEDAVALTNRDVDQRVRDLKAEIARIERLRGVKVVLVDGVVVTAYRQTTAKARKVVSRARGFQ